MSWSVIRSWWEPTNRKIYRADSKSIEPISRNPMKPTWSSSARSGEHRFTGFQVIRDRSRDWGSSVRSQWGRTSTSFHIFTIVHHKSMVFYVRFFLKANFERNEKSNYHNFGPLEVSIITKYRSDPWPNVLFHILITIQSLLTSNLTRLWSTEHI